MPLFLGMLEADAPLGPAISFLLASPTINLGAIVLLFIVFGWRIAIFYAGACLLAAVFVGWLLGRVPRRRALREFLWLEEDEPAPVGGALKEAALSGAQLTRKLLPWLALATLAGILLDTLVPTSVVARISLLSVFLAVPLAALLGSVVYADILFLIPIGFALMQHGAAPAVVLTFMLAASGISISEVVVLTRIMKPPLVTAFAGATVAAYIAVGFGFLWV